MTGSRSPNIPAVPEWYCHGRVKVDQGMELGIETGRCSRLYRYLRCWNGSRLVVLAVGGQQEVGAGTGVLLSCRRPDPPALVFRQEIQTRQAPAIHRHLCHGRPRTPANLHGTQHSSCGMLQRGPFSLQCHAADCWCAQTSRLRPRDPVSNMISHFPGVRWTARLTCRPGAFPGRFFAHCRRLVQSPVTPKKHAPLTCNVFCHVPLFVGLLVSKFYCRILSPCLNRAVSLSWLYAGVSVLCALPTLFACELAQGGPHTLALTLSSRGPIRK